MKIGEGTVVTMSYKLQENDASGELLEIMNEKYPFEFLFGNGNLLTAFEENIADLEEGDQFSFKLLTEEAYGEPHEGNRVNVPIKAFKFNGEVPEDLLQIGRQVTVQDDGGLKHTGKVLEYDDNFVRVDFNHVMAGKDLYFEGVILNVRKATVDELIRKHHIPGK